MLFEQRDTLTDGGRGQVLGARRACDRAVFGDADQAFEVANVQAASSRIY